MENRTEHLQWCKHRALEHLEQNDLTNAFASFQADMTKNPETTNHLALEMGTMLLVSGHLSSTKEMREWITGFN